MAAAGNPPNPNGHPTAYLWEEVWGRDCWLEILGRYIVAQTRQEEADREDHLPALPPARRDAEAGAAVLAEGAGGKYLIQHSAGSGKTNSIAWTAHFLADLHDAQNEKLFSTVIVVSDRNVIDGQLQEALSDFERTQGRRRRRSRARAASKSGQLAEALAAGKKIIVCTIQTFPFALEAVREQAATQGKRFAVIADEAHSSQTGEAAAKLKAVLSPEEIGRSWRTAARSAPRTCSPRRWPPAPAKQGITYRRVHGDAEDQDAGAVRPPPRPERARQRPTTCREPFHVYSMRQAIEEDFILDVLKNYTPYRLAFHLASGGKEWDDKEVERDAAHEGHHELGAAAPVQHQPEGRRSSSSISARTSRRCSTARPRRWWCWRAARRPCAGRSRSTKYIKSRGYKIGTLVAFSGEVNDQGVRPRPVHRDQQGPEPHAERPRHRRGVQGTDDYQLLLVANKFQTGFDQPLLCGMYVDRRLAGIQAVQTLSRLNRAHPGKDTTYVLDFVNSAEDILKAFKTYYETAELEAVTDPNLVYNLRAKLDATGHYDDFEVDRVAAVEVDPKAKQGDLVAAIEPGRRPAAEAVQGGTRERHDRGPRARRR